MAQEAFEAYGKSSPLPALPHHPFPPGYVPPPVSMGTGGSRHGTLSTMRRCGDYHQGATAAGDPGVRSLYHGEGREVPKENPPPPAAAKCLNPCLRRACVVPATCVQRRDNDKGAPPPHTPPPPRGCARRVGGATTGDPRQPSPPAEGQVPRLLPAPCLRCACDVRATKGRRHAPPPHTPPPPQGWGMQVGRGGQRPPPRGQSGKVWRQRREGAGRTTRSCP